MNASFLRVLVCSFWLSQLVTASVISLDEVKLHKLSKRATLVLQDYAQFQISDGTAGTCDQKASNVFLKPYGISLSSLISGGSGAAALLPSTIDQSDLKVCKAMAHAASQAENGFLEALKKFSNNSNMKKQLQNGMICNKVLKALGALLSVQMEFKLGKANSGRAERLAEVTQKLKKNIAIDKSTSGQRQTSFLKLR